MEGRNNTTTLNDSHQMFVRVDIKEEKYWSEANESESEDCLDTQNCFSEPATKGKINDTVNDGIEAHTKTELKPEIFNLETTEEKSQARVSQVKLKTEIQDSIQHLNVTYVTGAELPWSFEKASGNAVCTTTDGLEITKDDFDCKVNTFCEVYESTQLCFTEEKDYREETAVLPDLRQPCKCEVCGSVYPSASLLDKHYRAAHDDSKKLKCEICDKTFKWHSCLKSHLLLHEGKRPYECHLCEKSFTRISHLKMHILTHEGKKPYKCSICDRSFTELSNLKKHSLIHEGKKPYKCDICEKSFTQMIHLKVHNVIHEGKKAHKCKICDKSFTHVSYLKRHSRIHERPHKCEKCEKCFTEIANLEQHVLIHEEKRPHRCKVCGKSFKRMSHLRKHDLTHQSLKHPENENCEVNCTNVSEHKAYKNE